MLASPYRLSKDVTMVVFGGLPLPLGPSRCPTRGSFGYCHVGQRHGGLDCSQDGVEMTIETAVCLRIQSSGVETETEGAHATSRTYAS